MSKEYVIRIVQRDTAHPLAETMLIEAGAVDAIKLTAAVVAIAEMMKALKTPERVRDFMRDNAMLSCGPLLETVRT